MNEINVKLQQILQQTDRMQKMDEYNQQRQNLFELHSMICGGNNALLHQHKEPRHILPMSMDLNVNSQPSYTNPEIQHQHIFNHWNSSSRSQVKPQIETPHHQSPFNQNHTNSHQIFNRSPIIHPSQIHANLNESSNPATITSSTKKKAMKRVHSLIRKKKLNHLLQSQDTFNQWLSQHPINRACQAIQAMEKGQDAFFALLLNENLVEDDEHEQKMNDNDTGHSEEDSDEEEMKHKLPPKFRMRTLSSQQSYVFTPISIRSHIQ